MGFVQLVNCDPGPIPRLGFFGSLLCSERLFPGCYCFPLLLMLSFLDRAETIK